MVFGSRLRFDCGACILNNPVEAGLVKDWESYPLIGGTLIASNEE